MSQIQTAVALNQLLTSGSNFYMKTEPEVLDFTNTSKNQLVIYSTTQIFHFTLNPKTILLDLGLLNATFFQDEKISIIFWNIKNFLSYVRFYTKGSFQIDCKLLDLKILESFQGIKQNAPESILDALERMKKVFKDDSWAQTRLIYQKIHLPLMTEVLPAIETHGLYDKQTRKMLYSYYEIEGSANGRLCSDKSFKNCFVPHSLGPYERENLKPAGPDKIFMYLDYHNMEIAVLQWLSKDERLQQILDLDEDPYKVVFKLITGVECDSAKKRELCKNFFIGVIYGQSAMGLAKTQEISFGIAEKMVDKIKGLFSTAFKWVQGIQNSTDTLGIDYFGRKRYFEDRQYRVRNFIVSSPATIVCLEKLIKLHQNLQEYAKIAASIHDGYVIVLPKETIKTVSYLTKEILEEASELCPGLKLKSSCEIGPTLSELTGIQTANG